MAEDAESLNGMKDMEAHSRASAVNGDAATNICVDITALRRQTQARVRLRSESGV